MRTGQGFDAHRFSKDVGEFTIRLGGVSIAHDRQVIAHSDGDVLIHALCDALLGALALGDIGSHFPDKEPAWRDMNSVEILRKVYQLIRDSQYTVVNADMTLIAESPRVADHVDAMRNVMADAMQTDRRCISIKATTTEGMGFTGRGEGLAALAIVLLDNK